ncbi:DNA mismatch repair protein Mlh1 [Condylostylus longicornis]|uniref:DNA mismatch repair protein Mlh1 n=1 Tax=Condylostylus longicornis TaxID=2530218 RepID=UPI00244DA12C|nr:DNA mismatch repair protein Mlh1 [Condylostylus longicornis]
MEEPKEIKKLDEVVVNRIAAGEVIQKPANAIKEMLENSLDARATYIQITVKQGGLKLIQIQDNGTGIRKSDLNIVCERFTTSKLKSFHDLSNIATYGFRGEALASISHVAHLTIQTKTKSEPCAYKASYEDGLLKGSIKACAGNQGTIITVEDLFYNVPQRKKVLKSPNEEFQKISDIVCKYAVHNSNVGFVLRKSGENPAIKTNPNSTADSNIRLIFGNSIGKDLIRIEVNESYLKFKAEGWISNPNYSAKKGIMLLFINHRLVESQALKFAVDSAYATYLPKGEFPFIYISLDLEPTSVDVNVHPTKHEVHFLNEDEIIEKIKNHIESKLTGCNSARIFYRQQRLPGVGNDAIAKENEKSGNSVKIKPENFVRTDANVQKLDKFLISEQAIKMKGNSELNLKFSKAPCYNKNKKETKLTSILNMRKSIENRCSTKLRSIFKGMCFVGVVNEKYSTFQYENGLYLCDTIKASTHLFYQFLLYEFQNFKKIEFKPSISIYDMALIALDTKESGWTEEDGEKTFLADIVKNKLIENSPILEEYFNLKITEDGMLESLPLLLEHHKPSLEKLPIYILRLATDVDWECEEICFKGFCQQTAEYYAFVPHIANLNASHKYYVEHILYPAMKKYLIPSNSFKNYLFELTTLPTLYKVFERC